MKYFFLLIIKNKIYIFATRINEIKRLCGLSEEKKGKKNPRFNGKKKEKKRGKKIKRKKSLLTDDYFYETFIEIHRSTI